MLNVILRYEGLKVFCLWTRKTAFKMASRWSDLNNKIGNNTFPKQFPEHGRSTIMFRFFSLCVAIICSNRTLKIYFPRRKCFSSNQNSSFPLSFSLHWENEPTSWYCAQRRPAFFSHFLEYSWCKSSPIWLTGCEEIKSFDDFHQDALGQHESLFK